MKLDRVSNAPQSVVLASSAPGAAQAAVTVTPAEIVTLGLSPVEHTAYIRAGNGA